MECRRRPSLPLARRRPGAAAAAAAVVFFFSLFLQDVAAVLLLSCGLCLDVLQRGAMQRSRCCMGVALLVSFTAKIRLRCAGLFARILLFSGTIFT